MGGTTEQWAESSEKHDDETLPDKPAEAGAKNTQQLISTANHQIETRVQAQIAELTKMFSQTLKEELAPMKAQQQRAEEKTKEKFHELADQRVEDARQMQIAMDMQKKALREAKEKQEQQAGEQKKATDELANQTGAANTTMQLLLEEQQAMKKEAAAEKKEAAAAAEKNMETMLERIQMMLAGKPPSIPPPAAADKGADND